MRRIISKGIQKFEIFEWHEGCPEDIIKTFHDNSSAKYFLFALMNDHFNMLTFREFMVKSHFCLDCSRLDDQMVLEQLASELVTGRFEIAIKPVVITRWSFKKTEIPETETEEKDAGLIPKKSSLISLAVNFTLEQSELQEV